MAQEITVEDLTPAQQKAYELLLSRFKNNYDDVFYTWGRQSGKTVVLKLVQKELERLDKRNIVT